MNATTAHRMSGRYDASTIDLTTSALDETQQLDAISFTGSSVDGAASVTVSGSGAVTDVSVHPDGTYAASSFGQSVAAATNSALEQLSSSPVDSGPTTGSDMELRMAEFERHMEYVRSQLAAMQRDLTGRADD